MMSWRGPSPAAIHQGRPLPGGVPASTAYGTLHPSRPPRPVRAPARERARPFDDEIRGFPALLDERDAALGCPGADERAQNGVERAADPGARPARGVEPGLGPGTVPEQSAVGPQPTGPGTASPPLATHPAEAGGIGRRAVRDPEDAGTIERSPARLGKRGRWPLEQRCGGAASTATRSRFPRPGGRPVDVANGGGRNARLLHESARAARGPHRVATESIRAQLEVHGRTAVDHHEPWTSRILPLRGAGPTAAPVAARSPIAASSLEAVIRREAAPAASERPEKNRAVPSSTVRSSRRRRLRSSRASGRSSSAAAHGLVTSSDSMEERPRSALGQLQNIESGRAKGVGDHAGRMRWTVHGDHRSSSGK